ncbi:hypothetical protein JW960_04705 [candidate division KSB1 bacterium]|nr:hypothetical protein [candidate division KSB1 bacterium]
MTSNQDKVIILEKVGSQKNLIKIRFLQDMPANQSITYLVAALGKCFKHCYYKIIIDLQQLTHINDNFIATIVEATAKVRREKGDIKIINLPETAKRAISDFNAYMFLSVTTEEQA